MSDQHFAMTWSGPNVWPRISAMSIADRLIFQRPELTYHEARKRLLDLAAERGNEQLPVDAIQVMILFRKVSNGPQKTCRRFVHSVIDDNIEDSRAFLQLLRHHLVRSLPESGNPKWRVRLTFQSDFTASMSGRSYLGHFTGRWM